jgi:hypothetical protein
MTEIDGVWYTNDELTLMGLRTEDGPDGIDPDEVKRSDAARAAAAARGGYGGSDTEPGRAAGPGQTAEQASQAQQRAEGWLRDATAGTGDWAQSGPLTGADLDYFKRLVRGEAVSWDRQLREGLGGMSYDLTDLDGIMRQVAYDKSAGVDPKVFIDQAIAQNIRQGESGGLRFDDEGEFVGGYSTDLSDDAGIRAQQQQAWGTEGERMPDWARGTNRLPGAAAGGEGDGGAGGGARGGAGGGESTVAPSSSSGWPTFVPPDPLSEMVPDPYSYPDYEAEAPFAYDPYTPAEPFAYDPYVAPEEFAYDPFEAPTGETMVLDPSYQFRLSEGQRALDASAAARGTLRTGGHLKDTIGYGQQFASQEYGNIYDRASQQYGMNRSNALQNYLTNEGLRSSTYDRNLGLAQSTYGTNEAMRRGAWQDNYGVAKDIYGINAAGRLGAYDINRQNAMDAWQSQYGTATDLYGSQYQTAQDLYDTQQQQAELQFGREWDAYTFGQNMDYRYWADKLRADTSLADFGTR